MKRKISILILIVLFFTANTVLPFTLHFCSMMDENESCEHMIQKEENCCDEGKEEDIYITQAFEQCCLSEIVDVSLKEKFLGSANEFSPRLESLICEYDIDAFSLKSSYNSINIEISPPLNNFSNLYLINSVLLI